MVTVARNVTDTFLQVEQKYAAARRAPFVPDVAGARAAVAMTVKVLEYAAVAVRRAMFVAGATTQEEMHLETNQGARKAENRYVMIQGYVHDARQFASRVETLQSNAGSGSDSSELVQAANAAHYFALQAFYQANKMNKENIRNHSGTFK
jgi:hypothetical protein